MSSKNPKLDREIGTRMRAFRIQRGLSQTAVGKAIGVTFQQIQKVESGKNRISSSALVKVCELLDIKPEQLLGNGSGVFHSEPGVLERLFADKDMVRMLLVIAGLPPMQRKTVTKAMLLMVQAFQTRLK
jgi:transcriptional regulator with XRE-family HTH domain